MLLQRTRDDGSVERIVREARDLLREVVEGMPELSSASESSQDEEQSDSGNSEVQWGWDGSGLITGDVFVDADGHEGLLTVHDSTGGEDGSLSSWDEEDGIWRMSSSSVSSSYSSESITLEEYVGRYHDDVRVGLVVSGR